MLLLTDCLLGIIQKRKGDIRVFIFRKYRYGGPDRKNGERIYLAAAEYTNNAGLKQLLEWMAQEERHHAKWFKELKQKSSLKTQRTCRHCTGMIREGRVFNIVTI